MSLFKRCKRDRRKGFGIILVLKIILTNSTNLFVIHTDSNDNIQSGIKSMLNPLPYFLLCSQHSLSLFTHFYYLGVSFSIYSLYELVACNLKPPPDRQPLKSVTLSRRGVCSISKRDRPGRYPLPDI